MNMYYNWTDASTPQGRERLKELLDEGIEVLIQITRFSVSYARKCESGEYRCAGYIPADKWDSFNFEGIEFLDPSPRLEPSELQWDELSDGNAFANDANWYYAAFTDGSWAVLYGGTRIAHCDDKNSGLDAAKASIHRWRKYILKSMTGL